MFNLLVHLTVHKDHKLNIGLDLPHWLAPLPFQLTNRSPCGCPGPAGRWIGLGSDLCRRLPLRAGRQFGLGALRVLVLGQLARRPCGAQCGAQARQHHAGIIVSKQHVSWYGTAP